MSLGKRKADQIEDPPISKKLAKDFPQVKVTYHEGASLAKPVIATTPGSSLPPSLKFESFTRKSSDGSAKILLHSSTHPTIDFTATENDTHNDKHLKHYVAVFDPETGKLQVTEARRLTARSTVRRREAAVSDDEAAGTENKAVTNYSSRAVLTNTFGTKKSKKAVQSTAENRLLARGGDDANNPLSKAMLSSMPKSDIPEDTDTRRLAQSNKPLPVPDMDTEDVNLAYPLTSLVFPGRPSDTLAQMPIAAWLDSVSKDKPVHTSSRFVSMRVSYLTRAHLASPEDTTLKLHLQLLRYVLLLIEIARHISSLRAHSRIPFPSTWPPKTTSGNLSFPLISGALAYFFPGNQLTPPGTILLHTTILALALHMPPPSFQVTPGTLISDPTDLQMDLGLPPERISQYYKELGCKMSHASKAELALWGLEKLKRASDKDEDGNRVKAMPNHRFAKLTVPLVFPSVSMGRRQARR